MKKNKIRVLVFAAATAVSVSAYAQQGSTARDSFLRNQAYSEMQRVLGQVDVLESNFQDLSTRVRRIEGGDGSKGLKAEIDSLRAQMDDLRREMSSMRSQIVNELAAKISKMQKTHSQPPPPQPRKIVIGPHKEYVVQSGDTLSFIAQAFGTTVSKLKEMNGMKGDGLRVGQKLRIPMD